MDKTVVEWEDSLAGWYPFSTNYQLSDDDYSCEHPEYFEVVGNIYQNPELLEKK